MKKAFQIEVYGIVQGVGFRFFTSQKAVELKLVGHVKNRNNGSVFIQVSGDLEKVNSFLDWCHDGPPSAKVEQLDYEEIAVFDGHNFQIIRS